MFPSTTASAITTSYTGWTPLEHGLTGWCTLFGEAGCVGSPLPFQRRGEKAAARRGAPRTVYRAGPLFDGLARRSIVVTYRPIIDSTYNLHHCGGAERRAYDKLEGLVAQTVAAVKSGPDPKFVYAYWPEFDTLSHRYGNASTEARAHFQAVDAAFGELMARLSGTDTLVVATADHGFMDSARRGRARARRRARPRRPAALSSVRRAPGRLLPRAGGPQTRVHAARRGLARRAAPTCARAGSWRDEGWFGPRRRRTRASPSASATWRW